jgi:5'-nucleotidase
MARRKPLILLSNDDGVHSPGLMHLKRAVRELGEVIVVAPDRPRSSCSHAITLHKPLRLIPMADGDGDKVYACNGMPADCVALGIHVVCPRPPDLVIGGINVGPNVGDDVIYSGTVAVAREAALHGVKAFAISLADFNELHYETASRVAQWLAKRLITTRLPEGVFLNVNVPNLPTNALKGLRVVRRGRKRYEGLPEQRHDPQGRLYFWRGSERPVIEPIPDTDVTELANGFVTVTPFSAELTDLTILEALRRWEAEFQL